MVDTGAAFSMVTKVFVDFHLLPMTPGKGTFRQADSSLGAIIGMVDMAIQVHDHLELSLQCIAI